MASAPGSALSDLQAISVNNTIDKNQIFLPNSIIPSVLSYTYQFIPKHRFVLLSQLLHPFPLHFVLVAVKYCTQSFLKRHWNRLTYSTFPKQQSLLSIQL